jgi:hypothetical protein
MLDQMVSTLAALPQVAGSTPSGSEFRLKVKKSPSLVPCAKALVVAARPAYGNGDTGNGGPAQCGNGAPAVSRPRLRSPRCPSLVSGRGQGSGGFSVRGTKISS